MAVPTLLPDQAPSACGTLLPPWTSPRLRAAVDARMRNLPAAPGLAGAERWTERLETALLAEFRDHGEEEAFAALHALSRPALHAWVARRAAGGGDAAEIVQDAFVNVLRYAHTFRDEDERSFRRWVRAIAVNVIRRRVRRRGAGVACVALTDDVPEPADRTADPAELASAGEEAAGRARTFSIFLLHFRAALATLGARDRRALELVEVEGRSYAEARLELGVGLSNMKMIVFRARTRLRTALQGSLTGRLAG